MSSLNGKICVVTGAAGVLCSSLVEALLEEGAKVALLGRTESKLVELQQKLKTAGFDQTLVVAADVLDQASLLSAREKVHQSWGKVDILVNGAGGNQPGATTPLEQMQKGDPIEKSFFGLDMNAYCDVYELNFKGTLLPTRIFAEDMVENGGDVINISSVSAERPLTKVGAYSASKSSIDNFTSWLAVHLAPVKIKVNAIRPGFFATEQNKFLLFQEDGVTLSARGKKIIDATPMSQFGKPEDLKSSLKFLTHPGSRFVTGVVVPVDGGFSVYAGV